MKFAVVKDGQLGRLTLTDPQSFENTVFGSNTTLDIYRSVGLWPVEVDDPGGGKYEQAQIASRTLDTAREVVVETLTYDLIPVEQRKRVMKDEAHVEHQASLGRGFAFDGATFSISDQERRRVTELLSRIGASDNGRANSKLPRGKSTKRFRDTSGTAHDFNPQEIVDFAAAADDLIEGANDRLEELEASIDAATTHADLDAIDVTAGWPT